jgi:hypothetical protein
MQTGGLIATCLYGGGTGKVINGYNAGNLNISTNSGGMIGSINNSLENRQTLNLNNLFNFGNVTNKNNTNSVGSIIGVTNENSSALTLNATNVYSKPIVISVAGTPKPDQPIGWKNDAGKTFKDAILAANPTMREDPKYTLDYSKSPAFATELGDAFKYAPGRTPKLAWEK